MPDVNAWKQDVEGYYIEMLQGAQKDYSLDATELLGAQGIAGTVFTIPAGLTQIGAAEVNGKVVKFWLLASGAKGAFACSVQITGNGDPAFNELFPFRVIVK